DLCPWGSRNLVEQVALGFPVFQFFDRYMEASLDTHLSACLQVHADKIARSLENQNLPPHLLLETKPPIGQRFRHFQHGSITVIAQYLDHRVGFVDQNLGTNL